MSLHLSQLQLQQLAERRFLNQLVNILLEGAAEPRATRAELESPQGRVLLKAQVAKANRHGLRSELDVARYVICAWLLGVDFDTRFPAMAQVLASDRLTPSQKAESLERIATTLLETLQPGVAR